MPISAETYGRVALESDDQHWELVCGRLREKPGMTARHNQTSRLLAAYLVRQLDMRAYTVSTDQAALRIPGGSYYVPDLCVIPVEAVLQADAERPLGLEIYSETMPLVVEVWSPSTGEYDVETKFAEYRRRGDLEIWRIHPLERTLTTWRKQPDGGYTETVYTEGNVQPTALPGVSITLAKRFA
jgi:Uma2 family endonuclease